MTTRALKSAGRADEPRSAYSWRARTDAMRFGGSAGGSGSSGENVVAPHIDEADD